MSHIDDLLDGITPEDALDRLGVTYRTQTGSSGEQLNVEDCPFCGGSGHKTYMNAESGLGNCFHGSCQQSFNLFSFTKAALQTEETRNVVEWLENLAAELGWRPKKKRVAAVGVDEEVEWELPTSMELPVVQDGVEQNLQYLEDRGIDKYTAAHFRLRYCWRGWFNYTRPDGERGGFNFKDRVIIPVYDMDGALVTFQGRDITGTADRKYLFPPGLPGTAKFLYNSHEAKRAEHAILTEGVFDVIRTWMNLKGSRYDDRAVMGTFGISLSSGQDGADQLNQLIRLKKLGLKRVTLLWDAEPKAFKEAVKATKKLRGIGLETYIARLPEGIDPGDASSSELRRALDLELKVDQKNAMRLGLFGLDALSA